MTPANAVARRGRSARRTVLILAAATSAATLEVGCATGDAWRAGAGAMTSMLWSRATTEPGYDLYAKNMADSKAMQNSESLAAAPARSRSSSEARAEDQKPAAGSEPSVAASRPRGRATADESVRVTLGRPESLPVLKDPDGAPGPLVASTTPQPASNATVPAASRPPSTRPADEPLAPAAAPEIAAADAPLEPPPAEPAPRGDARAEEGPALAGAQVAAEASGPSAPDLKSILDQAKARLEAMSTYQVAITRVERVGNQVLPEEKALLSIRRNPKAVRLEWPEGSNKGREVIYSAAINERMMHVNVANSAIPIPRMSIPVDSPLALRNSRHAITEAGFDTIFNNLAKQVDDQGRPTGAEGRLTYKGLQKPEGSDVACHLIQRITPAKEVWRVYLDPDTLMPFVVTAHQADGAVLESYRYENLKADPTELASADAFDPDKRWGESKGLFSRLAKAAGGGSEPPPTATR